MPTIAIGVAVLLHCVFAALPAAASPLVACHDITVDHVSVCAVNMSSYATDPKTGAPVCPDSVTSTGPTKICQASFADAMADARQFFAAPATRDRSYLISIDAGIYNLAGDPGGPHRRAAIDVSHIRPEGTGCLARGVPLGTVALSGSGCLVVRGAGTGRTFIATGVGGPSMFGRNVSHVMFEDMTLLQANHSTSQGVLVETGTQTIAGTDYPTLTLDIARDFPTPLYLYKLDCALNDPPGCAPRGLPDIQYGIYIRAYTNGTTPALIPSISSRDSNAQDPYGFPHRLGATIHTVAPTQPDPVHHPDRWTVTLSTPAARRRVPSAYSGATANGANLLCMKVDDGQAFWFDDLPNGGTDIVLNRMAWIGAARGSFRGISGQRRGGVLGAQVYHSVITRGPPANGVASCLSTQSGGLQFGQPQDPPIYGNLVYGLAADATADDSIAMFNDIGGTAARQGPAYPRTMILHSAIANSFARDILLYNDRHFSGLAGPSPVFVDVTTRDNITHHGNCDPIVLGAGNCPVTYISP